jgi:hypothetical protein
MERLLHCCGCLGRGWQGALTNDAAGKGMKIYLLMLLIGTLLTVIHLTSVPERKSEAIRQ